MKYEINILQRDILAKHYRRICQGRDTHVKSLYWPKDMAQISAKGGCLRCKFPLQIVVNMNAVTIHSENNGNTV